MSTSINNSFTSFNGEQVVSGEWDSVLNYNTYYMEIYSSTNCLVTIYQTNTTNNSQVVTDTYNYSTSKPVSITGDLTCSNIKFQVTNLSATTTNTELNFSVIYKSIVNTNPNPVSEGSNGSTVLWNGVSVLKNGVSSIAQSSNSRVLSIFGHVSNETILTIQMSLDGETFYNTQYSVIASANADFGHCLPCAFNYIRLISRPTSNSGDSTTIFANAVYN